MPELTRAEFWMMVASMVSLKAFDHTLDKEVNVRLAAEMADKMLEEFDKRYEWDLDQWKGKD